MSSKPYIIYRPPPGWGFWSNFSCVLQGLDYADRHQLLPVVDMERYSTRYNEDTEILGTKNAWEYYFLQPSGLSLAEALERSPLDNGGLIDGPFTQYYHLITPPSEIFARGRELVRRYIHLRPEILTKLDALIPIEAGKRYLGVHVRGTDLRKLRVPNHPLPATPATYLEQAVTLDQQHRYSRVFIASDEVETIQLFEQHFGDRLLTIPAHRTSAQGAQPVSTGDYSWLFGNDRTHHLYNLGLEVLLDALLLSRCGHLTCGTSNVSQAAMYFSSEDQVVHAVTPLWRCAAPESASFGAAYFTTVPSMTNPASATVLRGQISELHSLIEFTENGRAEANQEAARLKYEFNKLSNEVTKLQLQVTKLQADQAEKDSLIERLRQRVSYLTNRWTRLGWSLMPWTKPKWRHKPLK